MPDDLFATEIKPIGSHYASVTRDALPGISPQVPRPRTVGTPPPAIPDLSDPEVRYRHQERMIVRSYNLAADDEHEYSSAKNKMYQIAKRALDISIAIPALIILSPVMLIVALAIRFDSEGPAVFKQQRVGKGGRLFCMYKFRSMTVNAGVRLNGDHKSQTDNRITRVGNFIRKTSLDELPQLVNVILGQMSLVGPRPELPEIVLQRYEPWQYKRLVVPQGITGWWQVTGRGKKMLWKHTADDLYYVARASFMFDVKLLFMTLKAVFGREGAF
jgi:lipopolysaccharide/colanic/teichoic acid biosynthesis glycosyltransferase